MDDITTLLLVDGEAGSLRGLRMRLALEPDLQVVGEVRWHDDVTAIGGTLAPAVVVVDVDAPAPSVAERVSALAAEHPVVALGLHLRQRRSHACVRRRCLRGEARRSRAAPGSDPRLRPAAGRVRPMR